MTLLRLILMVSLLGSQAAVSAQPPHSTPNFSGRWFIDKATVKASATRPFWTACGWDCTIAHTAAGLTVTPATGTVKTFAIGGPPVTSTIEGFGQVTVQKTSARWDQQRLVINVLTGTGDEFTSTTELALNAGRLVVTTTRGDKRGGGRDTAIYTRK